MNNNNNEIDFKFNNYIKEIKINNIIKNNVFVEVLYKISRNYSRMINNTSNVFIEFHNTIKSDGILLKFVR